MTARDPLTRGTVRRSGQAAAPGAAEPLAPGDGEVRAPDGGDATAPDSGEVTRPDGGDATAPDVRGDDLREALPAAVRPDARGTAEAPRRGRVPGWLQTGAGWSWRFLIIAIVIYLAARVFGRLYIVVVPCVAALLLTALLQPLAGRLRRAGLPPLAATWCTLLITAAVLGGLGWLITARVSAEYPTLVAEAKHTETQIQSLLSGPPFHVKNSNIKNLLNDLPKYLSTHKSLIEGTVVTGGRIAAEIGAGLVLMLFVMFFLIKDGERIWHWLIGKMQPHNARRWDRAGQAAWTVLVYYMRGTVAVAAIHGTVVGVALFIMDVPLALPLAIVVFVAAFIPLVGLLIAGALAVLVTLATKGWVDAVILVIILVVEDQLEAHLLQPQVVGRVIRLHPLAVILAIAAGSVLAGIPGALVAVPIVAVITRALPELRRRDPPDPPAPGDGP